MLEAIVLNRLRILQHALGIEDRTAFGPVVVAADPNGDVFRIGNLISEKLTAGDFGHVEGDLRFGSGLASRRHPNPAIRPVALFMDRSPPLSNRGNELDRPS